MKREKFLAVMGGSGLALFLAAGGYWLLEGTQAQTNEGGWPTNREGILDKITEMKFFPGSHLRTTLFFRKVMWEMAQVKKMNGDWSGGDESDWMSHLDEIDEAVKSLSENGFKAARLVVAPFEVTRNGVDYNWSPLDTALEILSNHDMKADLCIGPVDYPHGPGIRLPKDLEDLLKQEMADRGVNHINLSMKDDPNLPKSSAAIRDYSFYFLEQQMGRYGKDPRVDKLYVGNEPPDTHGIEGIDGTMSVDQNFLLEIVRHTSLLSPKRLAVNTNIHPGDIKKLTSVFGPIFDLLGDRGVLGIDAYPTQEYKVPRLNRLVPEYGNLIENIRQEFSKTEVVFTELQAEPWPPEGIAGQDWARISTQHSSDLVVPYFQEIFPATLQSYVQASRITEVGLWGAPLWIVAQQLRYQFPLEVMRSVSEAMEKSI